MANSKIYLGSTNIGSLFQGADDISIYLGDNKVYPLAEPVFDGKWKATYQDSHVESAECDSSSEIVSAEIIPENLVSVEIGDCVTSIGDEAFSRCRSLTSCTIPNSVTSIGEMAFDDCTSLTSISIPNGVTSIGEYTFEGCSSLTSINIPSGVTSIGENAFVECTSLTSIDIPSGVTSIDTGAFNWCSSLTSITVNATTPPTLGAAVFNGSTCPIYVPCESVEAYKSASGWSDYASRIACPPFEGKFKAIYSGGETYELDCDGNPTLSTGNTKPSGYQTSAMTEAIIGDCVTEIGEHAFYGYSGLTSVSIPDSVTTIGIAPFQNCYSLTSVTIPSGVTFIGNQAFVQCTGLTSVTCLATTPPTLDQRAFNTGNSCPIYVPSASVNAYKTATVWSGYASRIQAIP